MLELALQEQPAVRARLTTVEKDLKEAVEMLRPYALRGLQGTPSDPDLRYQLDIIDRALAEIAFILRPEDEGLTAGPPASSRNASSQRP